MPSSTRSWLKDTIILTLLLSFFYSMFLGIRPLTPPDEARYSEIPREMVVTGDYITPHLNGIKYFEKPALFYWLQSLSIKVFGMNEWTLRLVTELMGILGCLMTYWGTRKLYDRKTAILASLILGSSLLYAGLAHFITLDMTVSVFLTGSLLSFMVANRYPPGKTRRNYMWLMFAFAAFATLTKGLIGIIFPGMIIFSWLCLTKQWRNLTTYSLISGTCLFLAISLPWHILVQLKNPEFLHFYLIEQHFLRYLTNYADRRQPIWFFPLVLTLGFFPWTGFLLSALKDKLSIFKNPKQHLDDIFLFLWASLIFLFYWVSHSQLMPYILPIFIPLAILTSNFITTHWKTAGKFNFGFGVTLISSLVLSILVLVISYHQNILSSSTLCLVILLPLFFGFSSILYWRKKTFLSIGSLLVGSLFLVILAGISYEKFETRSIKPLATTLVSIIQPEDIVYTYNHYYQDLPVYIKRNVKVVNWTGELTFGSEHQPSKDTFLNDSDLNSQWSDPKRKFMVLKKDDLIYLRSKLNLKYYVISTDKKCVLICNQDPKK